jgi:hypothetical protein
MAVFAIFFGYARLRIGYTPARGGEPVKLQRACLLDTPGFGERLIGARGERSRKRGTETDCKDGRRMGMDRTTETKSSKRVDRILADCGARTAAARDLLEPLARQAAALEVDLSGRTEHDQDYVRVLRAYESALKALRQCRK